MERGQIENIFTYHKPFGDQPERYVEIREAAKVLANRINQREVGDGRQEATG